MNLLNMGKLNKKFTHPGTLIDPKVCYKLNEFNIPYQRAINQLRKKVEVCYEPKALEIVSIGEYGKGQGHLEICGDGEMCYYFTVAFLYFKDKTYAENAIKILAKWATTNIKFEGSNAPLESSWGVGAMIRCAELLKYTYTEWDKSGVEKYFKKWISTIIYPCLTTKLTWTNNWNLTMTEARLQLAIFKEDYSEFDYTIQEFKRLFEIYVLKYKSGQCLETKRDIVHSCFGIGSMINICEMAWHQGIDLYRKELKECMEYHAMIINGGIPYDLKSEEIKENRFQPIGWEIGLRHFTKIKKWEMPHTRNLLEKYRPEKAIFCWGLSTMTHSYV